MGLQDILGKQNFHEDLKKVVGAATKSSKDVFQDVAKLNTETSRENDKVPAKIDNKLLEIINDKRTLASYLLKLLANLNQ